MNNIFLEKYQNLPQYHLNSYLIIACATGQLPDVKFLTSDASIKEHADPHFEDESPFITACLYGHTIHFSSPLLKRILKDSYNYPEDYDGIIKYFIYDLNLNRNESINKFLFEIKKTDQLLYDYLNKLFEIKLLTKNLNDNLKLNGKKNKISKY